ncbi:MAG: hypothetical protein ABJ266_00005, partial [Winogradskyella arenosi]
VVEWGSHLTTKFCAALYRLIGGAIRTHLTLGRWATASLCGPYRSATSNEIGREGRVHWHRLTSPISVRVGTLFQIFRHIDIIKDDCGLYETISSLGAERSTIRHEGYFLLVGEWRAIPLNKNHFATYFYACGNRTRITLYSDPHIERYISPLDDTGGRVLGADGGRKHPGCNDKTESFG